VPIPQSVTSTRRGFGHQVPGGPHHSITRNQA